jgi:hypothetical protein
MRKRSYNWTRKGFREAAKFLPEICGEEHPGQIQKYYVQQEHRYPSCVIVTLDDLTKLFH